MKKNGETETDAAGAEASPTTPAQEKAAAVNHGYVVHELRAPVMIDGKETSRLILDFDGISGDAMGEIEAEMRADGLTVPLNPVMSAIYCQYVAARAAKVNIADIRRLSFKDNAVIVMRVQNFITN